jgi:hypothetical protein
MVETIREQNMTFSLRARQSAPMMLAMSAGGGRAGKAACATDGDRMLRQRAALEQTTDPHG